MVLSCKASPGVSLADGVIGSETSRTFDLFVETKAENSFCKCRKNFFNAAPIVNYSLSLVKNDFE